MMDYREVYLQKKGLNAGRDFGLEEGRHFGGGGKARPSGRGPLVVAMIESAIARKGARIVSTVGEVPIATILHSF